MGLTLTIGDIEYEFDEKLSSGGGNGRRRRGRDGSDAAGDAVSDRNRRPTRPPVHHPAEGAVHS